MDGWKRFVASIGENRIIAALGGLHIAMAVARITLWEGDNPLSAIVATDLLIILPGIALLYGGYRLPDTDLHPEVYPRVLSRCLAGIAVMLGVVGLLAISTGLNRPIFTPMAGTALGSVAGFAIGINESRALSKAYEAERHRNELRQERDLREQIFETSPIGIVVINCDGSIRMANEHAARITGLSEEKLETIDEYNHPMFEATDADGNPVGEGVVGKILMTGEAVYDVERQISRADGERVWLSVNGAPLRDPSGETTAAIIAFEDITDRKHLEQELKETVNRLETSNDRLEQFAYAASHDLQEPLRMVSSYLQLLETRYVDDLDEDAEEYIEFAVDGAERMRAMIESLLEYSRITARGDPLEQTNVDAVLEDVLADLRLQIEETDATITADELPVVTADREQLAQAFRNLISNALKYSGDEPPRVHVSVERTVDAWQFSVDDEGIGIDPEYHDRIFTVFEQLQTDQDDSGAGGIGLALCERIVERHGGEIWVESEPGEGTTFSFTIPESPQQQESFDELSSPDQAVYNEDSSSD